ncbi:hypothetical protein ACFE04_014707 [Oxalis oulophora]
MAIRKSLVLALFVITTFTSINVGLSARHLMGASTLPVDGALPPSLETAKTLLPNEPKPPRLTEVLPPLMPTTREPKYSTISINHKKAPPLIPFLPPPPVSSLDTDCSPMSSLRGKIIRIPPIPDIPFLVPAPEEASP